MDYSETKVTGCFKLNFKLFEDTRGSFLKSFVASNFDEICPGFSPKEIYTSSSAKNVVRGLHFQLPPHDHNKVVICMSGEVKDLILDLRTSSHSHKQIAELHLKSGMGVFIPKGCAHGFLSLSEESTLQYIVDSEYAPEHDTGILWNSIGFDWPVKDPILSPRDETFPRLEDFNSPF